MQYLDYVYALWSESYMLQVGSLSPTKFLILISQHNINLIVIYFIEQTFNILYNNQTQLATSII